jgi:hypothetical protein
MFLLAYDNPDGQNSFRYTIGWDIGRDGKANRWDRFVMIDDMGEGIGKIGNHGDGAGIAFTDLNGNGRPEMFLLTYDNPDEENSFRYVIGWDIGSDGKTTRWSRYIQVPGCGRDAYGADLAITNLDSDPKPDLVLMEYNATESFDLINYPRNSFRYRVGWNLDANGMTDLWSSMLMIPSPLHSAAPGGSSADGAGIAFGNMDGNNHPELIFMSYQNPDGQNYFEYTIMWNLFSSYH